MGKTLLTKVWDMHKVATLPTGEDQLFIGLHLVHEGNREAVSATISAPGVNVSAFPDFGGLL